MYAYSSTSVFPTSSWNATNYWVDVLFDPGGLVRSTSIIVRPLIADRARHRRRGARRRAAVTSKRGRPPARPENPLIAQDDRRGRRGEAAPTRRRAGQPADKPGYDTLARPPVGTAPRAGSRPCNLVTRSQAQDDPRDRVQAPVEAPQGPTCIYRTEDGKAFITLAVQSLDIDRLKKRVHRAQTVDVSDRTAYCGIHGTLDPVPAAAGQPRAQRRGAVLGGQAVRRPGRPTARKLTPRRAAVSLLRRSGYSPSAVEGVAGAFRGGDVVTRPG